MAQYNNNKEKTRNKSRFEKERTPGMMKERLTGRLSLTKDRLHTIKERFFHQNMSKKVDDSARCLIYLIKKSSNGINCSQK